MSECNHDCSSCGKSCASRDPKSFLKEQNARSNVKKVIGISSGKGGVGKSMVTSLLAVKLNKMGYSVGILDADITGPSIPKTFGLDDANLLGDGEGILPCETKTGIKVVSLNLMIEDNTEPVVWRSSIITSVVTQFWTEVYWGDIDVLLVDLPPGTGDVILTVYQSLPLTGVVEVVTPQQLVGMIVEKSVKMAEMMNIPVLGIAENMSYITCPDCGKKIEVFGPSRVDELAETYSIPTAVRLPINPELTKAVDNGYLEDMDVPEIEALALKIVETPAREF